jgi:hypothetical protein
VRWSTTSGAIKPQAERLAKLSARLADGLSAERLAEAGMWPLAGQVDELLVAVQERFALHGATTATYMPAKKAP